MPLANRDRVDADDLQDQPFLLRKRGIVFAKSNDRGRHRFHTGANSTGDVHTIDHDTVATWDFGMGVTLLPGGGESRSREERN